MKIFVESFTERRRSLVFWFIGFLSFGVMMVGFFKSMGDTLSAYDQILENIPPAFQALVGEISSLTTIEGYLTAELFNLMLPMMFAILGIGLGATLISQEESLGTLELLLARPITRSRIFCEKALALVTQLALMAVATWLGIIVTAAAINVDISAVNVFWATLTLFILALDFSLFALAGSVIFSRGISIGVTTVLFIATYFLTTLAPLSNLLTKIEKLSPFYYYPAEKILTEGVDFVAIGVLIMPAIILYVVGESGFRLRDIGT